MALPKAAVERLKTLQERSDELTAKLSGQDFPMLHKCLCIAFGVDFKDETGCHPGKD